MANNNSTPNPGPSGMSLTAILNALQQGVIAINNIAQTMSSIFPST